MEFEKIILEENNGVGYLTINQPKSLNALNSQVLNEIDQALDQVAASESIRVLVITGAGEKAFVAGADIKEMQALNAREGQAFSKLGNDVFAKLANLAQPSIAAVNGFALGGGCELALSCDMRIASENALFGQPEVGLGITPGFGGTQRLPRLVGSGIAKELILSARNVKSEEALRIGLVNRVVPLEDLKAEVDKLASKIASQGQTAVQMSKKAIDNGLEMPLANGLELEAQAFGLCFSTEDQKEGMLAFIEKRPAEFTNK